MQGTCKLGCPAHIEIKVYEVFPEYSIFDSVLTQTSRRALRMLKEEKMMHLRMALSKKENVKSTKKYFVSLPTSEAHDKTHSTGAIAGAAQKIHPLISQKIESLVKEGTTDPRTVQRVLKEYIHESMKAHLPCETDRSYYPTIADINNHIYKSKTALQLSKFDQHNLQLKIEEWKQVRSDSRHFFRPFKSHQDDQDNLKEPLLPAQSLLWAHQEKWQMELLRRYGNEMSLIDATYKTTKYDMCTH